MHSITINQSIPWLIRPIQREEGCRKQMVKYVYIQTEKQSTMCCVQTSPNYPSHGNRTVLMTTAFQGETVSTWITSIRPPKPQEVTQQQLLPWVTRQWTVTPPHLPLHLKSSVTFSVEAVMCGATQAACGAQGHVNPFF